MKESEQVQGILRKSDQAFLKIFEASPDAISIAKLEDGAIIDVNERFLLDTGFERSEIIGRSTVELKFWPSVEDRNRFVEALRKGPVRNWEVNFMTKPGEKRTGLVSAEIVEIGSQLCSLAIIRDITERKRAEEALYILRKAVDLSGEVIFMTDCEGLITFINTEFTRLYGYTEAEVVGKATPRILKSGTMQADDYAQFWGTLLSKRVVRGELTNKTKGGRRVTVEVSANPILDERGEISGFLAIQRDITGRKQLEEQYRQAQKMEAVGRLAGGVAHDFNNLLTIINGYSQLLMERVPLEDSMRGQLSEIMKSGERAAGLTRQLLAFSRRQVLEPRVLDLNNVLEGMHKMLRRLIGEDIELVTLPKPPLGQVKADPGQIEQVIMNLAVNSRDAMPRGGRLTLETDNVELDEFYASTRMDVKPGRYVMLAVTDTGHGMGAETLEHIFEPFFTTKGQGQGTGLGLSTVYGIVKQTGGHVSVYSEVGKGTTFKVYLPRLDQPAEEIEVRAEGAVDLSGSATILLVEDETGVRGFICKVLERRGYNVLAAGSPAEAVTLCEGHKGPIHLLLTDVVMPGFGGKELADHLAFSHPDMKVLFISGYTADAIAHHGILDAETKFLQKPFTPLALLRKIRQILNPVPTS